MRGLRFGRSFLIDVARVVSFTKGKLVELRDIVILYF